MPGSQELSGGAGQEVWPIQPLDPEGEHAAARPRARGTPQPPGLAARQRDRVRSSVRHEGFARRSDPDDAPTRAGEEVVRRQVRHAGIVAARELQRLRLRSRCSMSCSAKAATKRGL
jgi:hypothetical protein